MSALVSAANGINIGRFCSDKYGIIQRVQISSNITVTATADGDKDLNQKKPPFLNVSFSSKIAGRLECIDHWYDLIYCLYKSSLFSSETVIYTVSPLISSPALLITPNWPEGMKQDSTSSWIVNVPEEYSAQLSFINVSQPTCDMNHAEVQIQELGKHLEVGFREDKELHLEHSILSSFYLNMSNCEPKEGKFAILSKISLQKTPSKFLQLKCSCFM